ncbi:MAG: 4Fe-4S binding protein [Oscillospiraceae bacterium]|nr:4Fe-4S binding protein [Oscillospiraceae bacterium]
MISMIDSKQVKELLLSLEADDRKPILCDNCGLCFETCPVNALERPEIDQRACWNHAFGDDEEKQARRISCHQCRDICPYHLGTQNAWCKE